MRAYIAEMLRFMAGRPDHPVYRREMAGWSYVRLWRDLRRGCLPMILLASLGTAACCGLATFATVSQESVEPDQFYRALLSIGGAVIGLFYVGEMVLQVAGLVATVLTSTSISAEVEADTFGLLRLTMIAPREIVLAKFGAAVRETRLPVITALVTRTIFLVTIPLLLIAALAYAAMTLTGSPSAPVSPSPSTPGGSVASALLPASLLALIPVLATSVMGIVSLAVAGALWFVFYFIQPTLDMMLFSAIGVAASTLARTRASGLFAGFGLRAALWMAACMLNQIVSTAVQLVLTPAMILPATNQAVADAFVNNPGLMVTLYGVAMAVSVLFVMLVEFFGTIALLRFAEGRAARLPFNT